MEPVTVHDAIGDMGPIVVSLPHSGTWIPTDIADLCLPRHLRTLRNTDWFLPRLYDFLPALGITTVEANFSRYVIDVNRKLGEPLYGPYQRCAIYETNTWGEPIYRLRPSEPTLTARVDLFYRPYHEALRRALERARAHCGRVYLLELHSFMGPIARDVCLGDGTGTTQSGALLGAVRSAFVDSGFEVAVNEVFSGGHIVRHYARPPETESLQIEIRYSVYLRHSDLDLEEPPSPDCAEMAQAGSRLRDTFADILRRLPRQV